MPMKSDRQRRAMYAAASGKSTRGIPKSVGERYVSHDKPKRKRRGLPITMGM